MVGAKSRCCARPRTRTRDCTNQIFIDVQLRFRAVDEEGDAPRQQIRRTRELQVCIAHHSEAIKIDTILLFYAHIVCDPLQESHAVEVFRAAAAAMAAGQLTQARDQFHLVLADDVTAVTRVI